MKMMRYTMLEAAAQRNPRSVDDQSSQSNVPVIKRRDGLITNFTRDYGHARYDQSETREMIRSRSSISIARIYEPDP